VRGWAGAAQIGGQPAIAVARERERTKCRRDREDWEAFMIGKSPFWETKPRVGIESFRSSWIHDTEKEWSNLGGETGGIYANARIVDAAETR
jgi:hypothetical protein